uniref:RING-type domain-containing protein n=1 Tax=Araucaria cunninghamii TaxID=56994 RepID=A0A0D6QYL6_ARACU
MENKTFSKALAVIGWMFALLVLFLEMSQANVLLIGNNVSVSFESMEASFVLTMKGSGLCGLLQVAEPSDACFPLRNKAVSGEGLYSPFALIERGTCSFQTKVRHAEDAGFKAAIVYDNEDRSKLVTMGGNSSGINIYAEFVSKAAGQLLLRYAGDPDMECWIVPSLNTSWYIMVISFVSLVAMAALLAFFVFVRKYWLRHSRRGDPHHCQLRGMSCRQVKALPSLIFISVTNDNCTSETCAICLEDYTAGQKLRVLPCHHQFHAPCIDSWLTRWRTFCPVCKHDARRITVDPPVTEKTPLLLANSLTPAQSETGQSSFIRSPSMHISPSSLLPAESSHSHVSHIASSCMPQTLGPCGDSTILSGNSSNIGNTSLVSSGVQPSVLSSQNSLYASQQMDSAFTLPPVMPYCGGPVAVISPFNSTHSLPGYQECCV